MGTLGRPRPGARPVDRHARGRPGGDPSRRAARRPRPSSRRRSTRCARPAPRRSAQLVADPIDAVVAKVAEVDGREAIILTRPHVVAEFFHVDWTSQARRKIGVPVLHLLEHENFDEQAGGGEGVTGPSDEALAPDRSDDEARRPGDRWRRTPPSSTAGTCGWRSRPCRARSAARPRSGDLLPLAGDVDDGLMYRAVRADLTELPTPTHPEAAYDVDAQVLAAAAGPARLDAAAEAARAGAGATRPGRGDAVPPGPHRRRPPAGAAPPAPRRPPSSRAIDLRGDQVHLGVRPPDGVRPGTHLLLLDTEDELLGTLPMTGQDGTLEALVGVDDLPRGLLRRGPARGRHPRGVGADPAASQRPRGPERRRAAARAVRPTTTGPAARPVPLGAGLPAHRPGPRPGRGFPAW